MVQTISEQPIDLAELLVHVSTDRTVALRIVSTRTSEKGLIRAPSGGGTYALAGHHDGLRAVVHGLDAGDAVDGAALVLDVAQQRRRQEERIADQIDAKRVGEEGHALQRNV